MDPTQLRTFVAVARLRSFSGAARELGYTQSAVSQHIAALEADLGAALLHRRPVAPTEAGARLLEHALPLLARLDAARADVVRLAAPAVRLRLGASAGAFTDSVARALSSLHPSQLTVHQLTRSAVPAKVLTGEADLGLVDGLAAPSDPLPLPDLGPLTAVLVAEHPLAVALPSAHPLATRPGLALPDLSEARWLDAPEAAAPLDRLRILSGTDGFRPAAAYDGTDRSTLLALVAAGHGLAVLPAPACQAPGVTPVPLHSPRLVHRIQLLHGSLPDGPAARFAHAIAEKAQ